MTAKGIYLWLKSKFFLSSNFQTIIYIFQYLEPSDILAASLACRRFMDASQHTKFKNKIKINFAKLNCCDQSLPCSLFLNSFRQFSNIYLNDMDFGQDSIFWESMAANVNEITYNSCSIREKKFNEILKLLENLQTLKIEGCRELFMSGRLLDMDGENADDRKRILKSCSNITKLAITDTRYLSDFVFNRIVSMTPELISLELTGCHISFHRGLYKKFYPNWVNTASDCVFTFHYIRDFIVRQATKLKSLNFSSSLIDGDALTELSEIDDLNLETIILRSCEQLTNAGIINLVRKKISLIELDLSFSVRLTDDVVNEICNCLPNLRILRLKRCRALTDQGIKTICNLIELEILDISECVNVTGDGIIKGVATKLNPKMKEIHFSALNICEKAVIKIAESFPNLLILDLSYCFNGVTELAIQMISKHLTKLRELYLDRCDKITDAAMTGMSMTQKIKDYKNLKPEEEQQQQNGAEVAVVHPMERQFENFGDRNRAKISLGSRAEDEIVRDAKRKKVMLQMCEDVNVTEDDWSGYSLKQLTGLRVLRIAACHKISDISLRFSFQFNELREISFARCQQVSLFF